MRLIPQIPEVMKSTCSPSPWWQHDSFAQFISKKQGCQTQQPKRTNLQGMPNIAFFYYVLNWLILQSLMLMLCLNLISAFHFSRLIKDRWTAHLFTIKHILKCLLVWSLLFHGLDKIYFLHYTNCYISLSLFLFLFLPNLSIWEQDVFVRTTNLN